MKAIIKIAFLSILTLATLSCGRDISFGLGEEITIPFDKTASLFDNGLELRIKFTELIEESRCQPGMVCFWEGRALVEIEVNTVETYELEFSSASEDAPTVRSATYRDYQIDLISVLYDSDDDFGNEKKYSIVIEVNK